MIWLLPLLCQVATAGPLGAAVPPLPLATKQAVRAAEPLAVRTRLSNGLDVLCVGNPTTHTVAVAAFIRTSARAEAASSAGLRNFVARALVECSASDQPAIVDRVQELGLDIFAGATLDASLVTVRATAEDIGAAIAVLRDVLYDVTLNDDSLQNLRVNLATMAGRAGEVPEVAADRAAAARLYPNDPLGWPVEGLQTTIAGFAPEQVREAYAEAYVPNNMLVVVAGGVPSAQAAALVEAEFGSVLPGRKPVETSREPAAPRGGAEQLHCPAVSGFVHVGTRGPGLADPSYPAAMVALAMLGSGMGSRLYDALRRDEGVAYTFAAEAIGAREGSRTAIVAGCAPDKVGETEGRILLAARRLATELASPEEIQRAKEYICTGHAIAHQRSADFAHQLGALEVASGRGTELDRELPRLVREVTAEQVREVVRVMFETKVRIRVLPS